VICASFLASCSTNPPTLKALQPSTGQPHDVIVVDADGRENAQIVWDADGPGERVIPGGFQGAFMFSVPPNAVQGMSYKVKLQNSGGRSAAVTFNVPGSTSPLNVPRPPGSPVPFPAPRIDAVTVVGATFEPAGVTTTLYVQGANLDVGAVVSIKNNVTAPLVPVATASHRVLRNDDWFGVSHSELDYPIYHYSSAIVTAGLRPAEAHIWIVATNLDGAQSEPFEYVLPKDADTIDSDGDGLRDTWETKGFDFNGDGVVDVDLKALKADPYRRDVFVELDIMANLKYPPDSTVLDAVKRMFESAPILNVGEAQGIHLEIDASGKPCLASPLGDDVCEFHTTHFDIGGQIATKQEPDPFGQVSEVRFSTLKRRNFDNDRRGSIYHYGIWARQQDNARGGFSDMGDDFVISFDEHGITYDKPRTGVEALAHELGHDLGQLHAGTGDDPAYGPNYLSVMSYNWEFRTAKASTVRVQRATCLPFYYADPTAGEMFGAVHSNVNTIVDYSEGMAKALQRPTSTAAGSTSICGTTIDWSTVESSFDMLKDFANWRALVFDGPARNGSLTP
jgi:hypothetical protein